MLVLAPETYIWETCAFTATCIFNMDSPSFPQHFINILLQISANFGNTQEIRGKRL